MNPFEDAYWSLSATIIWIYFRDKSFLEENWKDLSEDNHFCAILHEATTIFEEDENNLRKREICAPIGDEKYNVYELIKDYEDAIGSLLKALKDKKITANGIKNGEQSTVGEEYLPNLKINYICESLSNDPIHMECGETTKWYGVKLERKKIIKLWPTTPIQETSIPPTEEILSTIISKIIKKYRTNDKKISRSKLYKEVNQRLPDSSTKITHEWARTKIKELPNDIKRKRGERGKNHHNKSDKK